MSHPTTSHTSDATHNSHATPMLCQHIHALMHKCTISPDSPIDLQHHTPSIHQFTPFLSFLPSSSDSKPPQLGRGDDESHEGRHPSQERCHGYGKNQRARRSEGGNRRTSGDLRRGRRQRSKNGRGEAHHDGRCESLLLTFQWLSMSFACAVISKQQGFYQ